MSKRAVLKWMKYYDYQEIQNLKADVRIERAMFGNVRTNVERVTNLQRVHALLEKA